MSFTYKGLSAQLKQHTVTDEEVDRQIEKLRQGNPRIALVEDRPTELGDEVVRLTLMLGLKIGESVLRGVVEKLAGTELVELRDALREQAAESYPIQLQLGTVRGEEAMESGYLI